MKIPSSTYRLQFNKEFSFSDAADILDYMSQMGVSDIYSSPVFSAVTGSMHGYDVTDHNRINPECGTEDEFLELHAARKKTGIGWIQDIVPNHMAFHCENSMLTDLLEHGKYSEFCDYFDIEWNHTHESLKGRILAPFLGKFYSESLMNGEINIIYEKNGLFVKYYEHIYPLSLISYPLVLFDENTFYGSQDINDRLSLMKLQGVLHQFRIIAESPERGNDHSIVDHTKKMLWGLYCNEIKIMEYMNNRLALFNCSGEEGENKEEKAERLDSILEKQMYRLSFWKVAEEEINYRRFFNINGLISMKAENENVFNHTHALLKKMINDETLTGIRVDHIDGLYNPLQYLKRLRDISGDSYIIAEKIITGGETLPEEWPVQGTTGYDFLNYLNGIYCRKENENAINKIYTGFTDLNFRYDELAAEKKRLIIDKNMTGDVDNLASLLKQISGNDRFGRDITMHGLRNALVEIIAYFPVYRTYIDSEKISSADSEHLKTAFELARRYTPEYSFEYDFLEKCLTLQYIERMSKEKSEKLLHFIMKFQQYTGPFMAKGFEDTVLYIANRLTSLNEVGGNPGMFGSSIESFHDFIRKRFLSHKYSMNATSTHDTKRGEDVRCRINVISELPGEWKSALKDWRRLNHKSRRREAETPLPDKNDEYFLYQTLIGTFPFTLDHYDDYVQRIKEFMKKSVREAKVHTAWIKPDEGYENNLMRFIDRILLPAEGNMFLEQFIPFQKKISFYGMLNSLSQIIIKSTTPGVPDFYQGTELWDLRLVDPDNRKKVNYTIRKEYLKQIMSCGNAGIPSLLNELWETREDGRIKFFLILRLMQLRKAEKELFINGEYIPLEIRGRYSQSVIAFSRVLGDRIAVAAAPRFLTGFVKEGVLPAGELWQDTGIVLSCNEEYSMTDVITEKKFRFSGQLMLRDLFMEFPGAVLTGIKIQK